MSFFKVGYNQSDVTGASQVIGTLYHFTLPGDLVRDMNLVNRPEANEGFCRRGGGGGVPPWVVEADSYVGVRGNLLSTNLTSNGAL